MKLDNDIPIPVKPKFWSMQELVELLYSDQDIYSIIASVNQVLAWQQEANKYKSIADFTVGAKLVLGVLIKVDNNLKDGLVIAERI